MRRSEQWFNDPGDPAMSALYAERYMNWGMSREELQSGRPIIGIAQTGSDLVPCNRHHVELAERVRAGIRDNGGIPFEFPVHPLQETGKRPTASLDRNLAYIGLVEILFGYPLDGVVLTTGCDKTTPALLMAAATVNIPAIVLSGGPMLNGWDGPRRIGSGSVIWEVRKRIADGTVDSQQALPLIAAGAPSPGHCNTMGTALTMNSIAEALGMSLPGGAAIPAPHRDRFKIAYDTGHRSVDLVKEDVRPSDILTRDAFENAIIATSAIGGSSNAPIHLTAIARHAGVDLNIEDWQTLGAHVPAVVNLQPIGDYLGEDFYRAGGLPAVLQILQEQGLLRSEALTVNGRSIGENCADHRVLDEDVIRSFASPVTDHGGFTVLRGNLFDSAIMKTSAISASFRETYLSDPAAPNAFTATALVFDGTEDYNARIDDPESGADENSLLVIRGVGPLGYPGAAEVVNMRPPSSLIKKGINELPCMGDGRQSGTSGSPSILNASPEAAAGGGLALLQSGDQVRIDLNTREVNALVPQDEWLRRRDELEASGGFAVPESQTPWQEIHRQTTTQLSEGMVMANATKYQRIVDQHSAPRHNH